MCGKVCYRVNSPLLAGCSDCISLYSLDWEQGENCFWLQVNVFCWYVGAY